MIKLTTGKVRHLGKDREYAIWYALTGEQEPTEQQAAFLSTVEAVWLDWTAADCPESYKKSREHLVEDERNYANVLGVRHV